MILGLTGCGEKNKFVGMWRSPYISDSEPGQGLSYLEIKEDGTYTRTNYIDGVFKSKKEGDYEIGGNELILYDNESHTSWYEFNYRSGALDGKGLYYTRYDESNESNAKNEQRIITNENLEN